ncbi:MAG TPA: nucleotidyltransferase family protein [Oscillatoriaceae cyanobacterium]
MTFSPVERLTLLLSLACHTPEERAELDAIAADPALDWAAVDRLASHNAIRPLAHRHLRDTGHWPRVPAAIAEPWQAFAERIAETNRLRLETAQPIFAAAAARGVRIAVLKGIYFAPTYYGDPAYKKMNDIDFLIRPADLEPLLALYREHHYFCLAKLFDDEKQLDFSHHTPPYVHRSLRCVLGTHWGLVSPQTRFKPDYEALWSRVVPFEFLGNRHWALHPVDNLHHLCLHLPYYKAGLREIADLYNLLRAEPDFDWALFLREVEKAHSEPLAYHALSLVNALVPMPGVQAAIDHLAPRVKGFYAADTRRRVAEPRRILHGRSTLMSEIDKAFGEFTMTDRFPEKWRAFLGMWGRGLVAPREEVARFHYRDAGAWYLPLLYPSMASRVIRYVAKDLGPKNFALLVLYMNYSLAKSAYRTATGRNKPDDWAVLAETHGLGREDLLTLKAMLE